MFIGEESEKIRKLGRSGISLRRRALLQSRRSRRMIIAHRFRDCVKTVRRGFAARCAEGLCPSGKSWWNLGLRPKSGA
jgi:hypothetical protein